MRLNDWLPDDLRQRLRPYLARCLGTADDGLDQKRSFMLADWAVRVALPVAIEPMGRERAEKLRALPEIVDEETAYAAVASSSRWRTS